MRFRHVPHTDRDKDMQRARLRYENIASDILRDPTASLREREVAAANIHLGNMLYELASLMRTVTIIARLPHKKRNNLAVSILREAEDYGDKPWDGMRLSKIREMIKRRDKR